MRSIPVFITGALALIATAAFADTRVFIIANPTVSSGVDRCLANGERCGAQAALAYCRSREFAQVKAYRRVDPDEVTGSVPKAAAETCRDGGCNEYVAIICQR
jgi:hypothetical protein